MIYYLSYINIVILARNDLNCAKPNDSTRTVACQLDENCLTMISQIDGSTIWDRNCSQEIVEAVGARCSTKYKGGKISENICKKTCTGRLFFNWYHFLSNDSNSATKCNNHLTMVDLTKMTVESAPENIESIKIEGENPQNQPNPAVFASEPSDSPAGVTFKPSTSGEKSLQVSMCTSLCSLFAIVFIFV